MEKDKEEKIIKSTQEEQVEVRAEESVVEQPKQKKNNREYNKLVIDSMSELIDRKLEGCKTGLPMILTIVTSVIAFLFAAKFENNKIIFGFAIVAMIALLIAFIALLWAGFPAMKYRNPLSTKKKKDIAFSPRNLESYIHFSQQEFSQKLQEYLNADFTDVEQYRITMLKEKINEYWAKKTLLLIANSVLIFGAAFLIVIFGIGLFIL